MDSPNAHPFAALFNVYAPQLFGYYRARGCEPPLAEGLAQEVMLAVYCKASQVRDRTLFRAWLFKIARNALCRHYGRRTREVETVDLGDAPNQILAATCQRDAGSPAFEFRNWMGLLALRRSARPLWCALHNGSLLASAEVLAAPERELMTLRFIEEWEYHEIAAARAIPIGTVQWRVFNAKKKLAPHLPAWAAVTRKAA